MAKKVIVIEDSDRDEDGKPFVMQWYFCPCCDKRLTWKTKQCRNCKSDLDWSDT